MITEFIKDSKKHPKGCLLVLVFAPSFYPEWLFSTQSKIMFIGNLYRSSDL